MCSNPTEQDNQIFACRVCDECIANRRHQWVARAMMERAEWPHAVCVTLTYSDATQHGRDSSAFFCYADVRAFMARLRSAAKRKAKDQALPDPVIRFLCAGEQGDRNGRCHWHLILFSNQDLTALGEVKGRYGVVTKRADMLTFGKKKRRLHWSLWATGQSTRNAGEPLGFVTFQDVDQASANYVLSYCLKDQFTVEKSQGTMREAKAENFATGLFRMSKRPAIGQAWLERKLDRLDAKSAVLPSLNFTVPGFAGFYQPSGTWRKRVLWGLMAINKRVKWQTGQDAPQWRALLAFCEGNENDGDILNGKVEETDPKDTIAARQRQAVDDQARREVARRCARLVPCLDCLHEIDSETLARLDLERYEDESGAWAYRATEGSASYAERAHTFGKGVNSFCLGKGSKQVRLVFPVSGQAG